MTEKKLAANRRNARLSTGPRTAEGKAVVSLNARTHGLRSRRTVLPDEDPAEFEQLCENLNAEWQPETTTEAHLVAQIAIAIWKLDRLESIESWAAVEGVVRGGDLATRVWQQQTRLERSRDKAIAMLDKMRKARRVEEEVVEQEQEPELEQQPEAPQPKPAQPAYVMQSGQPEVEAPMQAASPGAS